MLIIFFAEIIKEHLRKGIIKLVVSEVECKKSA